MRKFHMQFRHWKMISMMIIVTVKKQSSSRKHQTPDQSCIESYRIKIRRQLKKQAETNSPSCPEQQDREDLHFDSLFEDSSCFLSDPRTVLRQQPWKIQKCEQSVQSSAGGTERARGTHTHYGEEDVLQSNTHDDGHTCTATDKYTPCE